MSNVDLPEIEKILDGLNDEQREAVSYGDGPLLIVAGAGTGKTTVLARRYAWLMEEKGCKTENILALTFTEKAADEMESRVLDGLPIGAYDFWISTFHGMCQRILEEFAFEIGLPNTFRVVSDTDAWLMLKQRIEDLPLDHYRPLGNPTKFLRALLSHISRAKDEGVTAEKYLEFAESGALDVDVDPELDLEGGQERARLKELGDLYVVYQKMLRDEGCMDFGDLILETLRLFKTRPAVLAEIQKRFRYTFVDEFQDTNWAQYELVKFIAGAKANLTVVGDDDQAIYKFRGASLANILQFRDDFPNASVVTLTKNYRSRQEILDVAYQSIQRNNPYRLEAQLAEIAGKKKLDAMNGDGGDVRVVWYDSLEDEATGIADTIMKRKKEDPTLAWSDMAILVRSNDTAFNFIQALEQRGIPCMFSANRGLYSKPFILDILSLLTLMVDPHDSRHAWRVLTMDPFSISLEVRAVLIRSAQRHGISLWDAISRSRAERFDQPVQDRIERMQKGIESAVAEKGEVTIARTIQTILAKTGVLDALLSSPEEEKAEKLHLLRTFSDRVERYQTIVHGGTVKTFLDDIRLEILSGDDGALKMDPEMGPDFVNVMTIHSAKGLEFRHVFCVALVDQRFPTRRRSEAIPLPAGLIFERLPEEENTHLSEERRLFYVALTRAKETLTLTGASQYGGSRAKRPSCFLDETGISSEVISRMNRLVDEPITIDEEEHRAREAQAFPLKRRFSFTQLAAFQSCPAQYKFAHVYKIPIIGNEAKSFGQAMHKALHDILDLHQRRGEAVQSSLFVASEEIPIGANGFRVTQEEAEAIYKERWLEHAFWFSSPATKTKYNEEGLVSIRKIWKMWNEAPPNVSALERPFLWKLGEHSIRGSIDRMDHHPEGGVIIYDYKTGQPKLASALDRAQKKQLWLYQLALEAMGVVVKGLGYVYVRDGSMAEVPPLEGDKKIAFTEELHDVMTDILASDFKATPSDITCKYCDFKDICEFRKV
ncbi:MAG: ATP-dependent helicase [bacterium]|nr:ATP-dependent helicase [bacterium]